MKEPLISVLVPIYRIDRYLGICVESLLNQTYKNLEIILVDDGSTDGSGEMCDQIATRDPRTLVIHQKNQGLSGARNTGIRHATGEYVIFIDSDDEWLLDNGLDSLQYERTFSTDNIEIDSVKNNNEKIVVRFNEK